ncbi:Acetyltransferase (GNAT) domain-containing protein [Sphingomonas sp. OV641]|uniref:GNAT family N-acetyltransferase n=1 Tax=Sphingomonas sp. OV641 TaxID=1881068 RepID=UPI0008D5F190|nr:GNAT family N-acetyltransferase [Sphingomonas sp. OV641]SEJ81190.1 Acetyltransferase (GNAT) domain-containing protein [Sphingomonas sp. OV641]
MSNAALRLQIGARTIATIPRRLRRIGLSLDQALAGLRPALPPLASAEHGYLLTSLPETLSPDWQGLTFERQRYTRYYVDLAAGEVAWRAGLSGQTRSTLKRKAKKLAAANGGTLDIRRFRTVDELSAFHPVARALAEKTYQERLMGAGLPGDAASIQRMEALAAEDRIRAWLLFVNDVAAAYLWCSADGKTLRYDYVGHDPSFAALSPGSVLMEAALSDLFHDRFARFDFTEGEGQHKRLMASAGIACRDLLLLRPTLANRGALTLVRGFDAGIMVAKRAAAMPALRRIADQVRRA